MKLFCFPYAGGSAMIYKSWNRYLSPNIQLCPIELPGRGIRFSEECRTNFDSIIEDVYQIVKGQLSIPFAFFGHSMGAIIAYELARKFKQRDQILPIHLFLSGRGAPYIEIRIKYLQMKEEELYEEIKRLGGIKESFFEDETLRNTFLPIILKDFQMLESYEYIEEESALECDFSILNGKQDHTLTSKEKIGWKTLCKSQCMIHNFEGDHFFINSSVEAVVGYINQVLLTKYKLLGGKGDRSI